MDNEPAHTLLSPHVAGRGECERLARRVRPRADDVPSPQPISGTRASSPPAVAAIPRLGLAFILNDLPPPQDCRNIDGVGGAMTANASKASPVLLPPRRLGQWTPQSQTSATAASIALGNGQSQSRAIPMLDQRDWRKGMPLPLEATAWLETESTSTHPYWGGETLPIGRADTEAKREAVEHAHAKQEHDRTEEKVEKEEDEEKGDAQPTPRATVATVAPAAPLSRAEKRRGRTCRVDGCDNYIVHKGLCCRHGGARKCSTEGCECTAKYMGLCWKHGGSTWCKVDGCSKRAKAKGRCWAHGGGTPCGHANCTKVAVSNGLCWAHGGGKRCLFDGCNRPGYERTNGFCDRHFDEMQGVDYFEV